MTRPNLKWYKWDLLEFRKQTPFWLAAIGTLTGSEPVIENSCFHYNILSNKIC